MASCVEQMDAFDNTVEEWATYIERLEKYCLANKIENSRNVAMLLRVIGTKMHNLLCNLTAPTKPAQKSLKEIVDVLKHHLNPKTLVIAERFRFHN